MSGGIAAPAFRLDGARALVTGASRGIGAAIARAMAASGAHVALAARDGEALEALAAEIRASGASAEAAPLDVTDRAAMADLVAARGPFDIFVANAGIGRSGGALDATEADWAAMEAVNLRAVFFGVQTVARAMVAEGRGGAILLVSSVLGQVGSARSGAYAATKHGVEGLVKSLALELGPHGVRVNAIAPTYIETGMTAANLADPATRAALESRMALGRIGRVEEIAGPAVFLCSGAASLITGVSLLADGGWCAA